MERCCPPHKPGQIVVGGTQCECPSFTAPIGPTLTAGTLKVPVVLNTIQVDIPVDSIITLPEPALEIKNIIPKVKITQCLLLLAPPLNGNGATFNGTMLSLKGFVRKNLNYATRNCSNAQGVCGDIRHCTVDVPFSCMTPVSFITPPATILANSSAEFEYFRKQQLCGPGFAEKDHLLSGDFSEFNQVSQEFFNELPYCELVNARVLDYTEYLNRQRPCGVNLPFEEKEFRKVEEKMVVRVTLRILQNRQVTIGGAG